MEYDIREIEKELAAMQKNSDRIAYLKEYIFQIKKEKSEFISFKYKELERLKKVTQKDYDKFIKVTDDGGLPHYFDRGKQDLIFAQNHSIENMNLLTNRIQLENKYSRIEGRLMMFEALLEKVEGEKVTIEDDVYDWVALYKWIDINDDFVPKAFTIFNYNKLDLNYINSIAYSYTWQLIKRFKSKTKLLSNKALISYIDIELTKKEIHPESATEESSQGLFTAQLNYKQFLQDLKDELEGKPKENPTGKSSENLHKEHENLKKLFQDFKDEFDIKPKNKIPNKKAAISYIWQTNPDKELPELYKLMKSEYNLIAPETTLEQFKDIFTGKPIESINPIKWHQDNACELLYFNEAINKNVNSVWTKYQRMESCFVKPDGKSFNAVWKSLKTNIEFNLSEVKQKAINELVNHFRNDKKNN